MMWGGGIFDIDIGKMSKSNMIKYCRDEWIVIPTETMKRLREEREERINKVEILRGFGLFM